MDYRGGHDHAPALDCRRAGAVCNTGRRQVYISRRQPVFTATSALAADDLLVCIITASAFSRCLIGLSIKAAETGDESGPFEVCHSGRRHGSCGRAAAARSAGTTNKQSARARNLSAASPATRAATHVEYFSQIHPRRRPSWVAFGSSGLMCSLCFDRHDITFFSRAISAIRPRISRVLIPTLNNRTQSPQPFSNRFSSRAAYGSFDKKAPLERRPEPIPSRLPYL